MSFDIDVSKRLGDFQLRRRLFSGGGLTALVGPSGSGKTSLLNLIAGLLRPDTGHIRVRGRTLFSADEGIDLPPELRRAGYIFQDGRLFPHMTVERNLNYGRVPAVTRPYPLRFEEIIGFLGIGHLLERWPATLSGGEAQRVAIGRALLSGAEFFLMDEPLSSLDAPRKREIATLIDRMMGELGVPILYVTHDEREVERLASQVIEIS
jgi:molybdate transport system ATP-binding protein